MDVLARLEGLHEGLVSRVVGQDAQLDLGVVGREQRRALLGHERLADPHSCLGADRDVLHVGIGGGEPARGRAELVEGGVDAARRLVDEGRQRVHVGVLELGQPPIGQDPGGQLVVRGQLLEDAFVRGVAGLGLADHRQLELLEEDHLQLLRRGDQEGLPCEGVDLPLESRQLHLVLGRQGLEHRRVDAHAGALHAREHPGEGELHLLEELGEPVGLEPLGQLRLERLQGAGLLRRPARHLLDRQVRGSLRPGAASGELFPAAQALAEQLQGHGGQLAGPTRIEQVHRDVRVEPGRRQREAVLREQPLDAFRVDARPGHRPGGGQRRGERPGELREARAPR